MKPSLSFPTSVEYRKVNRKTSEELRLWKSINASKTQAPAYIRSRGEAGRESCRCDLVRRGLNQSPVGQLPESHLSALPIFLSLGANHNLSESSHTWTLRLSTSHSNVCTDATQNQRSGFCTRKALYRTASAAQIPA